MSNKAPNFDAKYDKSEQLFPVFYYYISYIMWKTLHALTLTPWLKISAKLKISQVEVV